MDGRSPMRGTCRTRLPRSGLLALPARQDAHTVAEGDARWGVPQGVRDVCRVAREAADAAAGDCQEALKVVRRLRGAAFLPAEGSACKVPLHSG